MGHIPISNELLTYLWVGVVSLWGGFVSYFDKMTAFSWTKLAMHLMSSSFAGCMTFLLCQSSGITGPMSGVFCGVAAHMGTPALINLLMRNPTFKRFFGETEKEVK
jgi:hypothetical protein